MRYDVVYTLKLNILTQVLELFVDPLQRHLALVSSSVSGLSLACCQGFSLQGLVLMRVSSACLVNLRQALRGDDPLTHVKGTGPLWRARMHTVSR